MQNATFSIDSTSDTGSVSGYVTLDSSNGHVVGSNVTVTDETYTLTFGGADSVINEGDYTRLVISGAGGYEVVLNLPVSTLVEYTGGDICTVSSPCDSNVASFFSHAAGNPAIPNGTFITGSLSPTPEPSSILLASSGILAATCRFGKRRIRAALAA